MNIISIEYFNKNIPIPICNVGGSNFMMVNKLFFESFDNKKDLKSFKSFLNTLSKTNGYKVKSISESSLDNLLVAHSSNHDSVENNNASNDEITNTADLSLSSSWCYVDDVLEIIKNNKCEEYIAVIKDSPMSQICVIYLSRNNDNHDLISDTYSSIKHALNRSTSINSFSNQYASQNIIEYLYSQHLEKQKNINNDSEHESKFQSYNLALLSDAIRRRATDIHIHFHADSPALVKFRIDTMLVKYNEYAKERMLGMLRNLYQRYGNKNTQDTMGFSEESSQSIDCVVSLDVDGVTKNITLRWQSIKTDKGMGIKLRVLDNDPKLLESGGFESKGYEDHHAAMIESSTRSKNGFVLITGTTGSGKTSSIIKIMLSMKDIHPEWSFHSVEDDIEYRADGIEQHPLVIIPGKSNGKSARELKSEALSKILAELMRFDPDVISVGEIRTEESAEAARDFVNTGHRIFATLHADGVIYTYDRLNDLGIDRNTLCRPGFFSLIVFQRLVPKTCPHCSFDIHSADLADYFKDSLNTIFFGEVDGIRIHNPKGCDKCNNGVFGMTLCAEMIIPDEIFSQFIKEKKYVEAAHYWSNEMPAFDPNAKYQGKTIEDHMLWKVKHGIVCPLIAGSSFDDMSIIARRKKAFLEPKVKSDIGMVSSKNNRIVNAG